MAVSQLIQVGKESDLIVPIWKAKAVCSTLSKSQTNQNSLNPSGCCDVENF